ncbi:MAG TPA: 16S rRNA (cytosine(1402)-N(4))-methyltransferase RsmH [Armatimonadota bacterium]|nr:16S rRNA (cytosine(1402)-N(4))-methyltransferase RsmH [Armatimonadota bacterium]
MCAMNDLPDSQRGYAENLQHEPVMLREVLEYLDPQPGETIMDCTLGGGGHALSICQRIGPTGRLIGIEQDEAALARAKVRLQGCPVTYVHDNFRHLDNILSNLSVDGVDGYLFDLGVSSFQLEAAERGFSFRFEAPLDMRMDPRMATTAADLVNRMSEDELMRIFIESGYGRWARRLAKAITATRKQSPINTTTQFAALITATIPAAAHSKIHPATKAFQALRIAVNDEIAALKQALTTAVNHSNVKARIVVLSYHSLEDGETKRTFQYLSGKRLPLSNPYEPEPPASPRLLNVLTKKPLSPSPEEVQRNPRSRSAKLRAAERIAE